MGKRGRLFAEEPQNYETETDRTELFEENLKNKQKSLYKAKFISQQRQQRLNNETTTTAVILIEEPDKTRKLSNKTRSQEMQGHRGKGYL